MGKRNHYVPQFYLRYFSYDKKNIKTFVISNKKFIPEAPIKRQCYEDHFYSKDPKIENFLTELEDAAKFVLDDILKNKRIPAKGSADYDTLVSYILFQESRTKIKSEDLNESIDKMKKKVISDDIKVRQRKDITIEDLEDVRFEYEEPALFSIGMASMNIPLLKDLQCKLIINNTSNEFITSDNPVILYNLYYLRHPRNHIGLACKGLLIFFPIDPENCLLLYDSKMYRVGNRKLTSPIRSLGEEDIEQINILQTINSHKTLYTLNEPSEYLENLVNKSKEFFIKERSKISESEFSFNNKNQRLEKLIMDEKARIKYKISIPSIKIRKKIDKNYLKQNLVRNPPLMELHDKFTKGILEGEHRNYTWKEFIEKVNL